MLLGVRLKHAESTAVKNGEWADLVSQAKLDGEKQAEKDFKDGTPKVASFQVERLGRGVCEAGYGAPEASSTGTGQLWTGSFFCFVFACCADESVRARVALYQRGGRALSRPTMIT